MIGVGVKNSTSDLLVAACDEFIFYDSLVESARAPRDGAGRRTRRSNKGRAGAKQVAAAEAAPPVEAAEAAAAAEDKSDGGSVEDRQAEAIDLVIETLTAIAEERGDHAKIWGSMVKQTLKRRSPGFSEADYGFRSFSKLLERAAEQGRLELQLDEKSGGYVIGSLDDPE